MPNPLTLILGLIIGALVATFVVGGFRKVRINTWERGALYIDGLFDRMLAPGIHWIWQVRRNTHVQSISLDRRIHSVRADVLSSERMALRLATTIIYRLDDAELSIREPVVPMIELAASLALTRVARETPLETLLTLSPETSAAFAGHLGQTAGAARIERAEITAVILPPELRRLTTEVERARLEGLAALERARSEQASLRSLANAARLLKDNPELAQLRLLKTVETAKGATVVLGDDRRR